MRISFYIGLFCFAASSVASAATALPDFDQVREHWRSSEARLLDRNGELLQEVRIDRKIRRTQWTPLAEVSPALIAAVLKA